MTTETTEPKETAMTAAAYTSTINLGACPVCDQPIIGSVRMTIQPDGAAVRIDKQIALTARPDALTIRHECGNKPTHRQAGL